MTLKGYLLFPLLFAGMVSAQSPAGADKSLLVRAVSSKTTCYLQEPLLVEYKLYAAGDSKTDIKQLPMLNGFGLYALPGKNRTDGSSTEIDGRAYRSYSLRRWQVLPLVTGDLSMDALAVQGKVAVSAAGQGAGNLDALLDSFHAEDSAGVKSRVLMAASNPLVVNVLPLPTVPDSIVFGKGVGQFRLKSELVKHDSTGGAYYELRLLLSGSGNWPYLEGPEVTLPNNISPTSTTEMYVEKGALPMSATKVYSHYFLVEQNGHVEIPPVKYWYFDPEAGKYKLLTAKGFSLNVTEVKKVVKAKKVVDSSKVASVQVIPSGEKKWGRIGFMIVLGILLIVGYIFWLDPYVRRRKSVASEPEPVLEETAEPAKTDPWLPYAALLDTGNYSDFYRMIMQAMMQYASKVCGLPYSQLSKKAIAVQLGAQGWADAEVNDFNGLLESCESSLYMPMGAPPPEEDFKKRAALLIRKIAG